MQEIVVNLREIFARVGAMQKKRTVTQPFQSGQVWQLPGSHLHIGHVGKTLVHYKHLKGELKRGPNLITAKTSLERFLKVRKALLVHPGVCAPPPAPERRAASRP